VKLVEPVSWDSLPAEVRSAIEWGVESRMLSTPVPAQQWAHRPKAALAQLGLYRSLFDDAVLDDRLRELVRLRVAALNDCEACSVARKSDNVIEDEVACLSSDDPRFSARERTALRFAELLVLDHHREDPALEADLRAEFTEPEIVELGLFVAMVLGLGRLNHVLTAR
jgi:alkylhydroperoxidase family enzyme